MKKSLIFASVLLATALPAMAQSVAVVVSSKNANTPSPEQISSIFLGKSNEMVGVDQTDSRAIREIF